MKNGIVREDDGLIYYVDDVPMHVGAVEIDGSIYYVGRHGKVATGQHVVHGEMSNGLLERGTYTFDEDGKLIEGSFIAPKKVNRSKKHRRKIKPLFKTNPHKRKRKINKKKLMRILGAVLAVVLLITAALLVDKISHHKADSDSQTSSDSNEDRIYMPEFSDPVNLCTVVAQKLYKNEVTMAGLKGAQAYVPFKFNYSLTDTDGMLYLSDSADMTNCAEFILAKSEQTLVIDNLKTGTTYYYRAVVGEEIFTGSFVTAEGTRYLNIPGVYNTRDIGGYTTESGKKIKQGMIIRGTEMDGLIEASYYLSQKDVDSVRRQFGFVSDIDLREAWTSPDADYTSPLGADVKHKFYEVPSYVNVFANSYKPAMNALFTDLAKEENYPVYLHCTYGADRTGTVVFLLQGLLGMSEEDMVREFQTTGFFMKDFAVCAGKD